MSVFSFLPDRRTVSCGIGRRIGCRWSLKNRSEIPASDTRWGAQIFNFTKSNRRFQVQILAGPPTNLRFTKFNQVTSGS